MEFGFNGGSLGFRDVDDVNYFGLNDVYGLSGGHTATLTSAWVRLPARGFLLVFFIDHRFKMNRFGLPFVKRFALSYQTVVSLSCLSVKLVYCGQMVGWIKMPLGTEVGLGPGHIVLDGDPAIPTKRDTAAPNFSVHV